MNIEEYTEKIGARFPFKIFALFLISAMIFACNNSNQSKEPTEELPNIVFIMADDMGYGDVGSYNPQTAIPTPNMDKLASEGIMFTDAHSPSAVCSPSRYGLLTGRYSWRTRLKKAVLLGYDESPLIEEDRMTLASLLKEKGYTSAGIGKWHVGLNWQTKNGYSLQDDLNESEEYSGVVRENEENIDFTKPVSGGPLDLGFDYFFGTFGCSTSDPPYTFIENKHTVGIPSVLIPDSLDQLPGVVKGLMAPNWSEENVDLEFTQKATEFIDKTQKANNKKPFFLYLALSSPHIPFLPPEFAKGKSEEGPRGDLVTVVDWSVGKIMETLDQYNLSKNTLVIVTSDNGPRKGANGHLSAGNFKGYKGSIWEGGHRVPFIARWPDRIKKGTTSGQVISLTDMFATFSKLTGATSTGGEDSYNILPAFFGEKIHDKDKQIRIFHSYAGKFAIRKGKWKFIEGETEGDGPKVGKSAEKTKGELYDLSTDPYETTNLWESNPQTVLELSKLLLECKETESVVNL
ncbi:arylsulfatase [Arenibacter algicola]|uniref:sulfatase family protein n=1 Tax=Arenibacter algicola TaxID=616991 RepID=UPI001C077423|nr:arylsulfatase [Arenibacter algicola]MBU2904194.1 arylsulfatase [Arenibacter algicola]